MKPHLFSLLLFGLILFNHTAGQAKQDTTIIYCNSNLDKVKNKDASHYAKIYQTADGKTKVEQYNNNGTPYLLGTYRSSSLKIKEGDFTYFNIKGFKNQSGLMHDNMRTGTWRYFAENGAVTAEGNYEKDKYSGEWNYYYDNGRHKGITEFQNGKFHGLFVEWSKDTLMTSGAYIEGEENGLWNSWFNTGFKNYQGVYKNGKRDGVWRFYHTNGTIAATEKYDNGILLGAEWLDNIGKKIEVPEELIIEPTYPGGMSQMMEFIMNEVEYPEIARDKNEQGIIYVQFVIGINGELSDFQTLKGVSPSLNKEALRVVKQMPNWTPGMDHNRIIPILFTLPVHFKLG